MKVRFASSSRAKGVVSRPICGPPPAAAEAIHPIASSEFRQNRSPAHPEPTLKGYQGLLHSDKHGAHEKPAARQDIQCCPCMAHVRRKFVEAETDDPELRRHILGKIRHLFLLERVSWGRDPQERLRIRRELEKPILDKLTPMIKDRLFAGGLLPKSKFHQTLPNHLGLAPHFSTIGTIPMPGWTTTWPSVLFGP